MNSMAGGYGAREHLQGRFGSQSQAGFDLPVYLRYNRPLHFTMAELTHYKSLYER